MNNNRTRWGFWRVLGCAGLLASLVAALPRPTAGASLVVTTLTDTNDGSCTVSHCSLREAINAANATGAADTISFLPSGTINLGSTLPTILSAGGALTIDGSGRDVTISGGGLNRVLYLQMWAELTLTRLKIVNGYASLGGGIYNQGEVTLDACTISGNRALNSGGGIYNEGTLTINNTGFYNNTTDTANGGGLYIHQGQVEITGGVFQENVAAYSGGAIYNRDGYPASGGDLTITDTDFLMNTAFGGSGGAIYNDGSLISDHVLFALNTAEDNGGAVYNEAGGLHRVTNCAFNFNYATFRSGGGIYIENSRMGSWVRDSTFWHNTAGEDGGAFSVLEGTAGFTRVVFKDNQAGRNGGAGKNVAGLVYLLQDTLDSNDADQHGGGFYSSGNMHIEYSTFKGNTAGQQGGAVHLAADAPIGSIRNSTFYGNSALQGGALALFSSVYLENCTLSANSASEGGGGGYHGILSTWTYNTIIANSPAGGNCSTTSAKPRDHGNNIDSGTTCGWGVTKGSLSGVDPLLGALKNNGGFTETMMPQSGSPAIDGVVYNAPNNCPPDDQRGHARPFGTHCDIGAVESYYPVYLPAVRK